MHHPLDSSHHAQAYQSQPALLILPDEESAIDGCELVVGQPPIRRLVFSARQAGFASIFVAPGTCLVPPDAVELATGEPIARPTLVVFESVYIAPVVLQRLAKQVLTPDEHFTFYDRLGRPAFWFTGYLRSVPNVMPIAEELAWPDVYGAQAKDVERALDHEDQERMAEQILQDEGIFARRLSLWQKYIDLPMIRFFVHRQSLCAHMQLIACGCAVSSGGIALLDTWLGYTLGALLLLVGIQLMSTCVVAMKLCFGKKSNHEYVLTSLGRASLTTGLTYRLMIEPGRAILDGILICGIGVLAVGFLLAHARALMQNQASSSIEITRLTTVNKILRLYIPEHFHIPVGFEFLTFVLALTGYPLLPWIVLVTTGLVHLWRWFASPANSSFLRLQR